MSIPKCTMAAQRNGDRERQDSEQVQLAGCCQDTEYAESHIQKSVEKFSKYIFLKSGFETSNENNINIRDTDFGKCSSNYHPRMNCTVFSILFYN